MESAVRRRVIECKVCTRRRRCSTVGRPLAYCGPGCKRRWKSAEYTRLSHETGITKQPRRTCDPRLVNCAVCHAQRRIARICRGCGTSAGRKAS